MANYFIEIAEQTGPDDFEWVEVAWINTKEDNMTYEDVITYAKMFGVLQRYKTHGDSVVRVVEEEGENSYIERWAG